MSVYLLLDPFQEYLEMSVIFASSVCMAICNNSTVGNENDLLG